MTKKENKLQKTYKFRLYPNKSQGFKLLETLELCRQTYNILLSELNNQKVIDKSIIQGTIPDIKICEPKFKRLYSKTMQYESYRLFSNLHTLVQLKKKGKKVGSLRFKSKKSFKSITYNQSGFNLIKTGKRYQTLHLSKIGEIPVRAYRDIEGKIKQIAIKITNSGKWFANITAESGKQNKKLVNSKQVGIDLGLTNYVYDSDNNHFDNPKYLNNSLNKLKKLQRKLSRKQKGSNNRNKQRLKVTKLHETIENQRNDFLHKLSRYYINNYNLIAVENLQIQNMIKNRFLSRSISDSSWAKFIKMLEYKAESAGIQVIKVNPRGTTQKCSNCNTIVKKSLKDREHICPCGLHIHRDYNSALKVLKDATVGSTGSNVWGNVSAETSMNQKFQGINT
ncbi:IS200/IS605 family element transposase accessory protein TnpB [Candidatus Woesearchaeota archaeon]|nr:IS200/IS605 family element transposase accessory protein TnpB [Candidatus Woesearchaeota archaeon]